MKQTRNMYGRVLSPSLVTLGFVEAGEIAGILFVSEMGASASVPVDPSSPMSSVAFFSLMSRVAAIAASSGLPCVSKTWSSILRPFTPPAAFASSIASFAPLFAPSPNVAMSPLSGITFPMMIGLASA